jgi:hypothetical protein
MHEFQSVEQLRWLPGLFGAAIVNAGPSVARSSLFRRERDLKADDMPPDHAEDS